MARPSSDLDLRNTDAAKPRKRSRRDRKKPEPQEALKNSKTESRAFVESLPINPGVITEKRGDTWQVQSPHNDEELWRLQLAQTFGTRSDALIKVFVEQLAKLCPQDWDEDRRAWRVNETEWNALIALVADHRPENSSQACLAAQMAATHLMTMRLTEQALNRGHTVLLGDAALAARLARTFAIQCETMLALKGGKQATRQDIHVTRENHIHYHDHRGGEGNATQSHGRRRGEAEAPDISEAVWSENESGNTLPSPSGERLKPVQISRGKSGSTEG